jgi:hypothetical protein
MRAGQYIHRDVIEIIQDYIVHAKSMKNIQVEVKEYLPSQPLIHPHLSLMPK